MSLRTVLAARSTVLPKEVRQRGSGRSGAHEPRPVRTPDAVDSNIADAFLVEGSVDCRRDVGCVLGGKGRGTRMHDLEGALVNSRLWPRGRLLLGGLAGLLALGCLPVSHGRSGRHCGERFPLERRGRGCSRGLGDSLAQPNMFPNRMNVYFKPIAANLPSADSFLVSRENSMPIVPNHCL